MKAVYLFLLSWLFTLLPFPSFSQSAIFPGFNRRTLTHDSQIVPYHLFTPQQTTGNQRYPLIVALHGVEMLASAENQWMNNNTVLKNYALGWTSPIVQNEYPAYVVAPHVHNGLSAHYGNWNTTQSLSLLNQLLDYLLENESIDPNRIYLTGHSMGGIGTLRMPLLLTNRFAAYIPLSSAISANNVTEIEQGIHNYAYTAIWSFHQGQDTGNSNMRLVYNHFKNASYAPHYTHNFGNEAINLSASQITSLIRRHQRYFYTEYSYSCVQGASCHTSVMDSAVVEPLLHQWLFRQYKIDPEAIMITAVDTEHDHRITWQAKNPQDSIEIWFKPDTTSDWTKVHQTTTIEGNSFDLATKVGQEQISPLSKVMLVVLNSDKFAYGLAQSSVENVPTALTNEITEAYFRVYPNPSQAIINLDAPINLAVTRPKYQIISMVGKVVTEGILKTNRLSLQDLPKGVYLLKIQVGEQLLVKKIMKHN
ncbi:hypothetical protein BKI52_16360 [marine bacterium AO1-C]|nr:hypothetical protein BKI52_16360 [marine bacterium AO1-C]